MQPSNVRSVTDGAVFAPWQMDVYKVSVTWLCCIRIRMTVLTDSPSFFKWLWYMYLVWSTMADLAVYIDCSRTNVDLVGVPSMAVPAKLSSTKVWLVVIRL